MKRGSVALIILAFIIVLGVTVNTVIVQKAQNLQSCADAAANDKANLTALEKEWKKQKIFFLVFADYNSIDSIDKGIAALRYADEDSYRFLCFQTAYDFALLAEETALSFGNVF